MPKVSTALRSLAAASVEKLLEAVNRELIPVLLECRRVLNILGGDFEEVTEDYTAKLSDRIIYVDATDGAVDITMQDVLAAKDYKFTVVKVDASVNAVNLLSTGISGMLSFPLAAQYEAVTVHSNGVTYYVVGDA